MGPEQDGQLSGDPVRSLEMRLRAWAGLYVFGRGLRMGTSWGFDDAPGADSPTACSKLTVPDPKSKWSRRLRKTTRVCAIAAGISLAACGPRANIPVLPNVPGAMPAADSASVLARALAPILYLQRDEPFGLERVVAVVHPTQRIIAYHLLWRDDAHGAWVLFEAPTDQEIVWVGYDSTTYAPTEVWTYWHRTILHTDWRGKGQVAIDVQWGKHGSLPRSTRLSDLPWSQPLDLFYLLTWIGLPDFWLGNIKRPGPWCFCHGYRRYASFTEPLPVGPRINAVVRSSNPRDALRAVFGDRYAKKPHWPRTLRDSTAR